MNKPVPCRYFHGDYHRGKNVEECRLLDASPGNTIAWRRALCDSCPVPSTLVASNSRDLALEAEVQRKLFGEKVAITFAVCLKHMEELSDPLRCPQCAIEQH